MVVVPVLNLPGVIGEDSVWYVVVCKKRTKGEISNVI